MGNRHWKRTADFGSKHLFSTFLSDNREFQSQWTETSGRLTLIRSITTFIITTRRTRYSSRSSGVWSSIWTGDCRGEELLSFYICVILFWRFSLRPLLINRWLKKQFLRNRTKHLISLVTSAAIWTEHFPIRPFSLILRLICSFLISSLPLSPLGQHPWLVSETSHTG